MASHKIKEARRKIRGKEGRMIRREKDGARNRTEGQREAGLLQGRGQLECKKPSVAQKNVKMSKISCSFSCNEHR